MTPEEFVDEIRIKIQHLDTSEELQELKDRAADNFGSQDEVNRRFKIESFGHHELSHASWIQYENWQTYIASHPANQFIEGAMALGKVIEGLMHEYYQLVACSEERKPDANKD